MGAQGQRQVLARFEGSYAEEIPARHQALRAQGLAQGLPVPRTEPRGMAEGRHHEALARQAEIRLRLVGDRLRVGQDQPRLFHPARQPAFYFAQAGGGLRRRIMQVGQVVQGHQHRPVEVQRPETGLMVEIDRRPTAIETPLLQPASCPVGSGQVAQPGRQTRIAGQRRRRQVAAPAPAMEQGKLEVRVRLQRAQQLDQVMSDAGPRRLENPRVNRNPHVLPRHASGPCRGRAGSARSVADSLRASRSSAIRRPVARPGTRPWLRSG